MIDLPFPILLSLAAVVASGSGFVLIGLVHDLHRAVVDRRMESVNADLTTLVFGSTKDAAEAASRLANQPTNRVLGLVQRLVTDLDGEAATRLQKLVSSAGWGRRIRRQLRS